MALRLIVFAPDVPYPPITGGRADVWRRLVAFKELGCEVMLVCWTGATAKPIGESRIRVLRSTVTRLELLGTRRGLLEALVRIALLPRAPSHAASRRLSRADGYKLLGAARDFAADYVWIEGPYPGYAACRVAEALELDYLYRSHNIEHRYMAGQAAAALSLRDKVAWGFACLGLRRFESAMILQARRVYDVSTDDLEFWRARGLEHGQWLAPLADATSASGGGPQRKTHDVAFLGNLTTPNNVRGVQWLVEDIVPAVLRERPETTFLVAGSNPAPAVESACAAQAAVTLLANPPDAMQVYRCARVLVNPVRTGSGIHMKSIDMLMTDAPLVSTRQGTRGLPAEIASLFRVHDDTEGFSSAIVAGLAAPAAEDAARRRARECFSIDAVRRVVTQLQTALPPRCS